MRKLVSAFVQQVAKLRLGAVMLMTRSDDMDRRAEQKLVDRALSGDLAAWKQLVDENRDQLRCSINRWILQDEHDAEGIFKDTLDTAHQKLGQFEGKKGARLCSWMTRIALNKWRDNRRRARTRKEKEDAAGLNTLVERNVADPVAELELAELREHLDECLQRLEDVDRRIVTLQRLEHWKLEDIAELLNLPFGTVRQKSYTAVKKLRPCLEKKGYGDVDETGY